jgi:hypothetical protein
MPKKKKDTNLHEDFKKIIKQSIKEQHQKIVEGERGYLPPIYFNEPFLMVHVAVQPGTLHRIWANSVHVECKQTDTKYKLKGMLNISQYPALTAYHEPSVYTLLFERPDPECTSFNLVEDIAELNGTVVLDIERNDIDVYFVRQ